tara:strand:- start:103 stop:540 length:438 start_codon:yes stop_codon:yes gene_type:complete
MKLLFIILFNLIINYSYSLQTIYKIPNKNYYLYTKKCDNYNNISIDFVRYQYNYKNYPEFCINNKYYDIFDNRKIDYMILYLYTYWHPCLNNIYIRNNAEYKEILYDYWADIYNRYGSCTDMNVYDYFNYSITIFNKYKKKLNLL